MHLYSRKTFGLRLMESDTSLASLDRLISRTNMNISNSGSLRNDEDHISLRTYPTWCSSLILKSENFSDDSRHCIML